MFKLDWEQFKQRYFNSSAVFAYEFEDAWCFYTYEGPLKIKCVKEKFEDSTDQMLFEQAVFYGKYNVATLMEDPEYEEEEPEEEYEYPQID